MTTDVAEGCAEIPVAPPLIATVGIGTAEKNLSGYVSVIVLPETRVPPAVVLNEKVALTFDFPATRSSTATSNAKLDTCPPIAPDGTPADSTESALVFKLTPAALLAFGDPIVSPDKVTVTLAPADSVLLAVEITMHVETNETREPDAPPFTAMVRSDVPAKKPTGYERVILLPGASAPPAVDTKLNVAEALSLPETRSAAVIMNKTKVTAPPITPDATDAEIV